MFLYFLMYTRFCHHCKHKSLLITVFVFLTPSPSCRQVFRYFFFSTLKSVLHKIPLQLVNYLHTSMPSEISFYCYCWCNNHMRPHRGSKSSRFRQSSLLFSFKHCLWVITFLLIRIICLKLASIQINVTVFFTSRHSLFFKELRICRQGERGWKEF